MDGVSREMEVLRRNQREALEIKGTVAEMNAFDGLTGRPRFIALSFAVLHRYYVYRLKACGKLNVAGLSAPLLQWHWLTLCVCFWYFSQHFKPFTNKKMMTC